MKKVVEGFWDCPYCDKKRILGRYYYCPNCGKGRGQETRFYPPEKITADDLINDSEDIQEPDQYCEYCDSYFPFKFSFCPKCGAERGKKNYFDVRAEQEQKEARKKAIIETGSDSIVATNLGHMSTHHDEALYGNENTDSLHTESNENRVEDFIPTDSGIHFKSRANIMESLMSFFESNSKQILFAIGVLVFTALLVFILMPRYEKTDVTSKPWSREITIESYDWVDRSGWSLPSGARLQYTREEFHHHERVYDHTETYEVPYTVTESVGHTESTVTHDRGNGYFEVEDVSIPIYETRTKYRTEHKDVYRYEDVYQQKYYYKIQEWVYNRSYYSNGKDDETCWPEYELRGDKERVGKKLESYSIIGFSENEKKEKTYSVDYGLWKKIQVGKKYEFKVVLGTITEIVDG